MNTLSVNRSGIHLNIFIRQLDKFKSTEILGAINICLALLIENVTLNFKFFILKTALKMNLIKRKLLYPVIGSLSLMVKLIVFMLRLLP